MKKICNNNNNGEYDNCSNNNNSIWANKNVKREEVEENLKKIFKSWVLFK